MSFGVKTVSGTGSTVSVVSSDTPPGVFLGTFDVAYSTTETRYYTGFQGTTLFVVCNSSNKEKISEPVITVNNGAKSVTVQSPSTTDAVRQCPLRVVVLGV